MTPGSGVNIYQRRTDTLKMETTGFFKTSAYFYRTKMLLALELTNVVPL
jgi:hypothetical protein